MNRIVTTNLQVFMIGDFLIKQSGITTGEQEQTAAAEYLGLKSRQTATGIQGEKFSKSLFEFIAPRGLEKRFVSSASRQEA